MDAATGRMGAQREIEDFEYAHKKRDTLQKEIATRGKELQRRPKRLQQQEILQEWRAQQDTYESAKKTSNMQKAQ